MKKAIVIQVIIFAIAWALMTPDQLVDNTYVFGLIGNVEVIRGNSIWVMLGAACLSIFNIWVWWPKKVKNTSNEVSSPSDETKSEVKAEDPVVPKMD